MAGILELINQLEEEQNYEDALEYLQIASDEQLGSYDIKKDTGKSLNLSEVNFMSFDYD